MKRMSEVIDLPVSADDKGVNDSNGIRFLGDFYCSKEKIEATAHAINHVDALADALEDVLDEIKCGGATRYTFDIAEQALAAYRGKK